MDADYWCALSDQDLFPVGYMSSCTKNYGVTEARNFNIQRKLRFEAPKGIDYLNQLD